VLDQISTEQTSQQAMAKHTVPERLSLCICTYNRCESLALTLESLTRQSYTHADNYELLIIDNNCTDDTPLIVESYAKQLPLRRIVERQQGLSCARNRAIAEFSGDVLLFTDDDVTLDPDWLSAYAIALSQYPEADIFGGRSLAAFTEKRPKWLLDCNLALLSGVLVNFDCGEDVRPFVAGEAGPVGASFGIRRRLIREMGGFRTDLGRIGLVPGRAEETEFFDRSTKRGAQRVYVGTALCWHRVERGRLTLRALYRHGFEKGRAHALMEPGLQKRSFVEAVSFGARGLGQLAKGRGDRARQCVINAGIVMGVRKYARPARWPGRYG
jgi:glucosyl-dolichyl phosphate glucuronosyltransferase